MKIKWLFLFSSILFFSQINAQNVKIPKNDQQDVNTNLSAKFVSELSDYALGEKGYDLTMLYRIFPEMTQSNLSANDIAFVMYNLAKYRGKKDYAQLLKTIQDNTTTLGKDWTTRLDLSLGHLSQEIPGSIKSTYIDYLTAQQKKNKKNKAYAELIFKFTHYDGIAFELQDYDKVLKLAKQSKKLIFMDAYTSWCGPCRMMSEKVFPQKAVGDFFNKNFICFKMDMEKGQGHDIAKKFGIQAFPTLLLIDENEKVVFSAVGYRESDRLLQAFGEAFDNYTKQNK